MGFFAVVINGVGNVDEILPTGSRVAISTPIFFNCRVVFFKCSNNTRKPRRSRGAAREAEWRRWGGSCGDEAHEMQTSARCMMALLLLLLFFNNGTKETSRRSAKNTLVIGATARAETHQWQRHCNWRAFFSSLLGSCGAADSWAATLA